MENVAYKAVFGRKRKGRRHDCVAALPAVQRTMGNGRGERQKPHLPEMPEQNRQGKAEIHPKISQEKDKKGAFLMISKEKARQKIMAEVTEALAVNDYLTVARIYARLSSVSLDSVIAQAVSAAIDAASETELAIAEQFAEKSSDIREATKARRATE